MKHILALTALAGLALSAAAGPLAADDAAAPSAPMAQAPDAKALGSDTVVIVVSDTSFGPDADDADIAARYYCANRGKISSLVGKERPLEFRSQVLQQWSLLTYRCVPAGSGG
jgi:hypothetical protein